MIKSALQSSLTNDVKYNSMSVGNLPSSEYLIQTALLSGSTSFVDFDVSGLSSVYRHLQICYVGRTARAAGTDPLMMRFNSDSGSNYNSHSLYGSATTVGSTYHSTVPTYILAADAIGNAIDDSNRVSNAFIEILDPFNPNKFTTMRSLSGIAGNNDPRVVALNSGTWRNTTAVTTIRMLTFSGSNFLNNTRISLYGVV